MIVYPVLRRLHITITNDTGKWSIHRNVHHVVIQGISTLLFLSFRSCQRLAGLATRKFTSPKTLASHRLQANEEYRSKSDHFVVGWSAVLESKYPQDSTDRVLVHQ